ncbi:hypothetical protein L2E82_01292 [Cichorium intybus]|uniref:Uncharacterized protein n=1 Tax=Cichorium intybus TaxID=13427 RepID=A0ACB9GZL5_CICIN|nr:hypothetical protein L1887_22252 [Cichorium endivia]KAI3788523.1 hypothetical protein L2E82_01292 [Cichorium intybus]
MTPSSFSPFSKITDSFFSVQDATCADQEPLSSNSLNIQMHRSKGTDSGDSSGSPPKDGAGPGAAGQS